MKLPLYYYNRDLRFCQSCASAKTSAQAPEPCAALSCAKRSRAACEASVKSFCRGYGGAFYKKRPHNKARSAKNNPLRLAGSMGSVYPLRRTVVMGRHFVGQVRQVGQVGQIWCAAVIQRSSHGLQKAGCLQSEPLAACGLTRS